MARGVDHVVVFTQEDHTTDNYFTSMRAWGRTRPPAGLPSRTRPCTIRPHTRAAYANWLHDQQAAQPWPTHTQLDTDTVLYSWLVKTGAFCENHCSGFGTISTPNHLLIAGGQTPTLRKPPRNQPGPVWDMPSLPGHGIERCSRPDTPAASDDG
ncbi:MAG TPA: hypothetical protein VFP34_14850 [Microlunatus sp.]|nr:hypothetical protein [Microlunatus sp.]